MKRFLALLALTCSLCTASAQTDPQVLMDQLLGSFENATLPSVPTFKVKDQTVGSQYLYESWVPGTLTGVDGKSYSEGYLFNFNKMTQHVYVRLKDAPQAFLINKTMVGSVDFNDGLRKTHFEKVKTLDSNQLYQVLAKGSKHTLYSFTTTKFTASNYFTNGVSSSGNMYDEYKDESVYYVQYADGHTRQMPLKRKVVKAMFEEEKEKVAQFFKQNDNAEHPFDVKLVAELVNSL